MPSVSVTYSFSNGGTIDAAQVNQNFTDIINGTSDGTKDFNINLLTVAAGSSSTCAISKTGDANTGWVWPAADNLSGYAGGLLGIDIKSNGSYANVAYGGAAASASSLYAVLIERDIANTLIMQISNPSTDAAASAKIQLAVDGGDKLGELAVWTDSTAVAAYTSAFVVRPNGNSTRLSLIGGDLSTGHIAFYTAGDYAATGEAFRVNADKSVQWMQQIATPATPASGSCKVYPKSDDWLWYLNDGGTEFKFCLTKRAEVVLHTGNGHGSSATRIRCFTTKITDTGSPDITTTQDTTNGDKFTINTAGVYAITYVDSAGAAFNIGISVNASSLTTDINNLSYANGQRIAIAQNAANYRTEASITLWLAVNDVVRAHDDSQCNASGDNCVFRIVRVL